MKKKLYFLFAMFSLGASMATQNVTKSVIIASTLVLSNKKYDKSLSLDLHKGVERQDYTLVQKLITNPQVDVNAKVDYGTDSWAKGYTPLIWCCRKGDEWLQMAKVLLEHEDINVNLQKKNGWTPLIQCSWRGDEALQIAQALLGRKEINVNLQDKNSNTPLMCCCTTGDVSLQVAKALLACKEINVNLQDNEGWTPLIACSWQGDKSLQIAKALLEHEGIKINLQDNKGWTPLIMCSEKGDKSLQIAKALLARKEVKVNLQDNDGDTPLDHIIYWTKSNKESYRYVDLWNLLVAKGAVLDKQKKDYNNLNSSKFTEPGKGYIQSIISNPPRHCIYNHTLYDAIKKANYTLAENLINNPYVDVNLETNDGWTPLTACSWRGDKWLQIAKALLDRKDIKVNLQNSYGATPLIYCCDKGDQSLQIVRLLLARNEINVNLQDNKGRTPLIMCCIVGDKSLQIATALLEHKYINIDLKDSDGKTPLDTIVYQIKNNKKSYQYFNLWNVLVAKGAMLDKGKKEYENLNPNNFRDPQKAYVRLIKQNPPKNSGKSKLMEEETKDDE